MSNLKKWIETKGLFLANEELTELTGSRLTDWDDFTFDIDEVIAFNRAESGIHTTIHLSNGYKITVEIPYDTFKKLYE